MLPDDWVTELQAVGLRRAGHHGWKRVEQLVPKHIAAGRAWDRMLLGWKNYKAHCDQEGKAGTSFVLMAQTFFGPGCYFEEWADMDMRTPAEIAADRKWQDVEARAAAVACPLNRSMGLPAAIDAVNRAEREAQQRQWRERGLDLPKFGARS